MNKKFFVSLFISLVLLVLAFFQPYKLVVVVGNSMYPTLKNGQILLAKKVNKFEKGDIVVFKNDFEETVIKRILFMPGEYYYFVLEHDPYVTELIYDNSYRTILKFYDIYGEDHIQEQKIPAKEYYVIGDNHNNSDDSRRFGPIYEEQLMYKVIK